MIVPGAGFMLFASGEEVYELHDSWGFVEDIELPYSRTGSWPYGQWYIYKQVGDFGQPVTVNIVGSDNTNSPANQFQLFTDTYETLGPFTFGASHTLPAYTGNISGINSLGLGIDGMDTTGTLVITSITFGY